MNIVLMDGELEANRRITRNIRILRDLKGFRQGYIAAQLGITPNGYGKIERGESSLTVDRLEAIARILGMSVPDIIDYDPDQESNKGVPHKTDDTLKEQVLSELDGLKLLVKELQDMVLQHSKMLEHLMAGNP